MEDKEPMINRENFHSSLNGEESKYMNDCERFGMISGCRRECPVLQAGKCELQEENSHLLED